MIEEILLARQGAQEKLTHALTLVKLAQATASTEMRAQHLAGVERMIEMVLSAMKVGGSA